MTGKRFAIGFNSILQKAKADYLEKHFKKVNGDMADEHYWNRDTGESLLPEYITMSRKPGIAHDWFEKFGKQVYPNDYVTMRGGLKLKPPRYYDKIYDLTNPKGFAKVKTARIVRATSLQCDNSPERLSVKEKVAIARLGQLKRSI